MPNNPPAAPTRPKWTEARVRRLAARIDRLNAKAEDAVNELFYSDFPDAYAIVEELRAECVVLASASDIVEGYLTSEVPDDE